MMESRWGAALWAACYVIPAGLLTLWTAWTAMGVY